jgi:hypothetical protein
LLANLASQSNYRPQQALVNVHGWLLLAQALKTAST